MLHIFSPDNRYRTWRRLWIVLAEAERELGVPITAGQVRELKRNVDRIDYAAVRREEEKLKHDVMAHIRVYAAQCPSAGPIIHLGATSMYVVDNADLVLTRQALELIRLQLVNVIDVLAKFAKTHAAEPTVAFTHFQPAQFTTVGRRAALWLQDLLLDLGEIERRLDNLLFLVAKKEGDHGRGKASRRRRLPEFLLLAHGAEHRGKVRSPHVRGREIFQRPRKRLVRVPAVARAYERQSEEEPDRGAPGIREVGTLERSERTGVIPPAEIPEPFLHFLPDGENFFPTFAPGQDGGIVVDGPRAVVEGVI